MLKEASISTGEEYVTVLAQAAAVVSAYEEEPRYEVEDVFTPDTSSDMELLVDQSVLFQDVEAIKQQGTTGPEAPWRLRKTGFQLQDQMASLYRDMSIAEQNGKTREEVYKTWLEKTRWDIIFFRKEYLTGDLVIISDFESQKVNGVNRIISPKYGGAVVGDLISKTERKGMVKKTFDALEEKLLANPGATAIVASPPGWTGLGHKHREAQLYMWQLGHDNTIKEYTIRTDMTISQNEKLLTSLGIPEENFKHIHTEADHVIAIESNIIFYEPPCAIDPHMIVNQLEQIKGTPYAYKEWGFTRIRELLDNPEQLDILDEITENEINQFLDYAHEQFSSGNEDAYDNIEIALGVTILKINRQARLICSTIPNQQTTHAEQFIQGTTDYVPGSINSSVELADLQEKVGCNGGGTEDGKPVKGVDGVLGFRTVTPSLDSGYISLDYKDDENLCRCEGREPHFHCIGKNNTCPQVFIVGKVGRMSSCPSCGQGKVC